MVQKNVFNLLYKLDSQLTILDKITRFLVPLRFLMLLFMLLVLVVFGFRFFWDLELSRLIKESERYLKIIEAEVEPYENFLIAYDEQIKLLKKYVESNNMQNNKLFFFNKSEILEALLEVEKNNPNVIIKGYNISFQENRTTILISGEADSFKDIDKFVLDLKNLEFVLNAFTPSQFLVKDKKPEFTVNLILKDKLYER